MGVEESRQQLKQWRIVTSIKQHPVYKNVYHKVSTASRRALLASVLIPVFVMMSVSLYLITHHSSKLAQGASTTAITLQKGTPDYATVLPAGKSIDQLGGWTRVSPPSSSPVFAYTDTVNKILINVSEQPLPSSFKSDTAGQVAQLAKGFNATEKLSIGSTIVYVGTYDNNLQRAIFTNGSLLILIKSDTQLTSDQWISYVNSLK